MKLRLLILSLLMFQISVSSAEDFGLYSNQSSVSQQEQNGIMLSSDDDLQSSASDPLFDFYEEPTLQAPPGGGPPIGGVPVDHAYLVIILLGALYVVKYKVIKNDIRKHESS